MLADVPTRDACCAACWSEALCTAALHSSEGACLLQTAAASGAATTFAATGTTAQWTRCQPQRAEDPIELQIPASVPGDLISDLQRARQIGDPWFEKVCGRDAMAPAPVRVARADELGLC